MDSTLFGCAGSMATIRDPHRNVIHPLTSENPPFGGTRDCEVQLGDVWGGGDVGEVTTVGDGLDGREVGVFDATPPVADVVTGAELVQPTTRTERIRSPLRSTLAGDWPMRLMGLGINSGTGSTTGSISMIRRLRMFTPSTSSMPSR